MIRLLKGQTMKNMCSLARALLAQIMETDRSLARHPVSWNSCKCKFKELLYTFVKSTTISRSYIRPNEKYLCLG